MYKTARKQRVLGGIYPGQSAVSFRIDIIGDVVVLEKTVDGRREFYREYRGDQAAVLKDRLRSAYKRIVASGRWQSGTRMGYAFLKADYPSKSWRVGRFGVSWL